MKDDWISARAAVTKIAPYLGGDPNAQALLANRLRDGALAVSAVYLTEAIDIGAVPSVDIEAPQMLSQFKTPDETIEIVPFDPRFPQVSETSFGTGYVLTETPRPPRRMILGAAIPRYSADWNKDLQRWDWGSGTFVFSRPAALQGNDLPADLPVRVRYPMRYVIYGATFKRRDIQSIVDGFRAPVATKQLTNAHERKRRASRKHDWTSMYTNLAAFAYVHGLDQTFEKLLDQGGWQTKLEEWIETYFRDRAIEIGDGTARMEAQRFVEAIWNEKNRALQ